MTQPRGDTLPVAAMVMAAGSLNPGFFARPADLVARELIGCSLLFQGVGGVIVETEAYDERDPASHSARGPTARNRSMFGAPGHAYLYRSYGLHWCFNIVCGARPGAAVLVRALQPVFGIAAMRQRRGDAPDAKLCAGPGRLCAALGLDGAFDGYDLSQPPFALLAATGSPNLLAGSRIGISRAVDVPWRFGLAGSLCLSRPFGRSRQLSPGGRSP